MQENIVEKKKEVVQTLLKEGILLGSDFMDRLKSSAEIERIYQRLQEGVPAESVVFSQETDSFGAVGDSDINWQELERTKARDERSGSRSYSKVVEHLSREEEERKAQQKEETGRRVKVIQSYAGGSKKREVQDFVDYFTRRFRALEGILHQRQGLQNTISIKHILRKKDKEHLALIGMVNKKETTKNGNLMITVEDPTGYIKVLINKNKPDLFRMAKDFVMDEVIGVVGVNGQNIVFANEIYLPDIPHNELKKAEDDTYVAFLSDLHVGSNMFLPEDLDKFLKWLNGEIGNEKQREIASKIQYLFIAGDLVDGVGIYPGQEDELTHPDIYAQYEECAKYLKRVPDRITMIICPGNHDAGRLSEPQPVLQREYCKPLFELENAIFVSNPALVNIHASEDFPGFDVLMYHGYSFDYYVAEVNSLRSQGGYDRADLIMRFLLQRRHLAPAHSSTLYIPDTTQDPLVIQTVPDFFISGHIHKSISANYKNTTMICGSCWQAKTAFQEKVGHHPEPSRVPLVNLKTREVKILKFGSS